MTAITKEESSKPTEQIPNTNPIDKNRVTLAARNKTYRMTGVLFPFECEPSNDDSVISVCVGLRPYSAG